MVNYLEYKNPRPSWQRRAALSSRAAVNAKIDMELLPNANTLRSNRQYFRRIFFHPISQGFDMKRYVFSQLSQAVLNLRRAGGIDRSQEKAIRFQSPQGLGQHFFADAAYTSRKFTETSDILQKQKKHQRAPARRDVIEHAPRGTIDDAKISLECLLYFRN